MSEENKKTKISIYLDKEKAIEFKHRAIDTGKTMTQLLDEILTEWLIKNK